MKELAADRRPFLFVFGLFVISFILYWPNPHMGFALDDHYVVARNPVIKTPSLYPQILTSGLFDAAGRASEANLNYYRPVLAASYAVDYAFWGPDPFGYRIVNIVLHAANSALVFILFLLLLGSAPLAALTALLFCILPAHEWVVRYIVGRGDLLQAFFSLLSFICVVCHCEADRPKQSQTSADGIASSPKGLLAMTPHLLWYLSLGFFVLAILSRETAVLNAIFVFLITYYTTRNFKRSFDVFVPFLVLSVVYCGLRAQFFPIPGEGIAGILTGGHGFSFAAGLVLHWLTPALVLAALPHGVMWAAALALGGIVFLIAILMRDKNVQDASLAGFTMMWIAAGLLPLLVSHRIIGRLGPVLSEHFLYFASIGFALLLAFVLERMRMLAARKLLFVATAAYFLSVGLVSGYFWSSEHTLLRHVRTLENSDLTVAQEQLVMRFEDDEETVGRLINRATSASNRSLWMKRLGNIYHRRGEYPKAVAALQMAVEANPSNIEAFNELGVVYLESGERQKGFIYLNQSLHMNPNGADAWRLMGTALYLEGDFARAAEMLRRSRALDPDQMETSLYLMMAQYLMDDHAAYLDTLETTSRRFSYESAIVRFVGQELFRHERFADAVKILEPTQPLFAHDKPTMDMLAESRRRTASLPK